MMILSLLAIASGAASTELDQLKNFDHDHVTRICVTPDSNLVISTEDEPQADGNKEIVKIWAFQDADGTTKIAFLEQDGVPFNPMVNKALGIAMKRLFTDPKTGEVKTGEFATGAIGYDQFITKVRVLIEADDKTWKGYVPTATREFQPNFLTNKLALIGFDNAISCLDSFGEFFSAVEQSADYLLYGEATRSLNLSGKARLLRTPRRDEQMFVAIWDGKQKIQFAINDAYEVIASGPVAGPMMPVIDETEGLVNTVVPTGIEGRNKVIKRAHPDAAILVGSGSGNIAERYQRHAV